MNFRHFLHPFFSFFFIILTFPLKSRMLPPGVGSAIPAPKREKTSESSRDVVRRYIGGDCGGNSVSSLVILVYGYLANV